MMWIIMIGIITVVAASPLAYPQALLTKTR